MSTSPTPTPKTSIWDKIKNGLGWFGKEIGKGFTFLPKVIVLADDAEEDAKELLPQTLLVVEDAGALVTAGAKDSGKFIVGVSALGAAVSLALANKAVSISADEAVVAAVEAFAADFKKENVQDILNAWHKLATDATALDAMGVAALKKLEKDA